MSGKRSRKETNRSREIVRNGVGGRIRMKRDEGDGKLEGF